MRVSQLSEIETLQLTASVWAVYDSKWNCFKCMTDKNHEAFKRVKGCVSTPKTNYKVEGFELNTCLGNFARNEFYSYMEMLRQYEKGIMPFPGAMAEQPAKVIDIFNMISQLRNEKEAEKQERVSKRK